MDIKVMIAMHKPYQVPADTMYVPLHVGAAGKLTIEGAVARDDKGEHISEKNPSFCELTALYWAWKNVSADAIGLVHYRRYFTEMSKRARKSKNLMDCVLTKEQAEQLLGGTQTNQAEQLLGENQTSQGESLPQGNKAKCGADAIVPAKRRYYIESLYSHYSHTHDGAHLDLAKKIIDEKYPTYSVDCQQVFERTWGYMFNMCIMKKDCLDAYCQWLFSILFEMEKEIEGSPIETDKVDANKAEASKINPSQMSSFDARFYGRVSEILFNVWILHHQKDHASEANAQEVLSANDADAWRGQRRIKVVEVATMHMEPINWWKKGTSFLKAKFFGKKYSGSF